MVLIVTILFFFLLFVYSTVPYPLLGYIVGRKFYIILVFSKEKQMFSYWLENWLIITLKFGKCFAHSLTIRETKNKFCFLVVCDFVIILMLIAFRKLFLNQIHFAVYILYQACILAVNIMLLLLAF